MLVKKKLVDVKSGEKITLMTKVTIAKNVQDLDDKEIVVLDSNLKPLNEKKTMQQSDSSKTTPRNRLFTQQPSSNNQFKSVFNNSTSNRFITNQTSDRELFNKSAIARNSKTMTPIDELNDNSSLKSITLNNGIASSFKHVYTNRCESDEDYVKAYLNYTATKLLMTYIGYIRFPDNTTSLLKAETVWFVEQESPIQVYLHLKSSKIQIDQSVNMNIIIENNLDQDLDFSVDESSFKFIYSLEERNFGALMLENKLQRNVYVPPLTQDTIVFSFIPIKSGLIELEKLVLYEQKMKKHFTFVCNYKILIN